MSSKPPPNIVLNVMKEYHNNIIIVFSNLRRFAETTYQHLNRLSNNDKRIQNAGEEWILNLYQLWMRFFLQHYDRLKKRNIKFLSSRTSDIFSVLSQAKFLLMYNRILDEKTQLKKENVLKKKSFLICETIDDDDEIYKPIMSYTQSEVMDLLLNITENLCNTRYENIIKIRNIVNSLYTRNSIFYTQPCEVNVLNVPMMREQLTDNEQLYNINTKYRMYCSIYFHKIFKRFQYYDIGLSDFKLKVSQDVLDGTKKFKIFFETTICKFLGSESIGDIYLDSCNQSYIFPGDDEWVRYLYPSQSLAIIQTLQCTRPKYADSYFSENCLTIKPILAGASANDELRGRCCRMFVINSMNRFFNARFDIPDWKACVVISNENISTPRAQTKMSKPTMPFLVEFVSRYWVYNYINNNKRLIWVTDDIYLAIALWIYILKIKYNSILLEDYNISNFIDKIYE